MSTARRISVLRRILSGHKLLLHKTVGLRHYSSAGKITIGDVSKELKVPKQPAYVPANYVGENLSEETLSHLRWMLQKDLLQQDMFLIGRPGPLRRTLAMQFLELTRRELEYVSLSRDTTESDLKQRREIAGGTASYLDQSAVRAATQGRVLLLEGIEKVERNVLPVLNNLLENREMQLEDGRFLMAAPRYDQLLREHSQEEMDAWKLVRVDEDFRVIALGLPVPRYTGNPLDPPLRSRFQARDVTGLTYQAQVSDLTGRFPGADPSKLAQLVSCAHALLSAESEAQSLPDFPADNLSAAAQLLELFPGLSVHEVFHRLYPFPLFLAKEGGASVREILGSLRVRADDAPNSILEIRPDGPNSAKVSISAGGVLSEVAVPRGEGGEGPGSSYVETEYQGELLGRLVQSHSAQDVCLVGPKGCGKSATVRRLAELLAYQTEPIVLYQDMTSRDLLQQRTTLANGDTVWRDSPLVAAALSGKMALLDGLHRIHASTLAVVHRLVHDRELQLYDGKRLLRHDRYDAVKQQSGLNDAELQEAGVLRIHPSFRIVALAEPPTIGGSQGQWLSPEMLSLFLYHQMRPLSMPEELHLIHNLYGGVPDALRKVVEAAHFLRGSADQTVQSLAGSLSTRQLLRVARRMKEFPQENVYDAMQRACLARFLPSMARQALDSALAEVGVVPAGESEAADLTCQVDERQVTIGSTTIQRHYTEAKSKVPDVLFFDVPQHLAVLEWLMQDFALGEHLLLVGNQGVGKNKLADRLLFLLNRPRDYIQLHRDTTVQTLTLQPTVRDGVVVYEDSPLVQACKFGHVLVVDEADKAPTHVTCILKTLVESGEMILCDGRRIVPHSDLRVGQPGVIGMHPDFRMIVLANRPGFPFLGNDFFGALGDLFSCHAVDNPSQASEIALLKNYGPDVPEQVVLKLVRAFSELRAMADQGLVQYPYSTREVVNVVKHLQKFPEEGIASVVRNVFDFDSYSQEAKEVLVNTLHKHGIPIGTKPSNVALGKEYPLPALKMAGHWKTKFGEPDVLEVSERSVKLKGGVRVETHSHLLDRVEARSSSFTEQQFYFSLPLVEPNVVAGAAVTMDPESEDPSKDTLHVLVANPASLFSVNSSEERVQQLELRKLLESTRGIFPNYSMASLGGKLHGCLLIHDENNNKVVIVCPETKEASQIMLRTNVTETAGKISQSFLGRSAVRWRMKNDFANKNWTVLFEAGGNKMEVLDVEGLAVQSMQLPFDLQDLHLVAEDRWLLEDTRRNKYIMEKTRPEDACPSQLRRLVEEGGVAALGPISGVASVELTPFTLGKVLGKQVTAPNRLLASRDAHAALAVGLPDLAETEIFLWPKTKSNYVPPGASRRSSSREGPEKPIFLPKSGQVVRPVARWQVPADIRPSAGVKGAGSPAAFIEVADLLFKKLRYIPVPEPRTVSPYTAWLLDTLEVPVQVCGTSGEGLASVDAGGTVRFWETGVAGLERALGEWRRALGGDPSNLQLTIEQPSGRSVSGPKYGKVDPTNDPHVGGNTWAGGTGGRDTAGLGGKGGPYRLDAGHNVYQVSQEEKDAVPEHVKRAAREMGRKAFEERLRQIRMSEYDAQLYAQYSEAVHREVRALRVILSSLQAKAKERQWLRHQTTGELDDAKLIEGLTGEKGIYRRRAEREPELGAPQLKPKRLKLVVDVSGSMYRFNSYDGRLDRVMEAATLMMEAFEGHEDKFQYDIVGHSGESCDLRFVDKSSPPTDNKQRLDLIKTMHAHAQFCMSGDHTLEATSVAVEALAKEDCDEAFVVVLSDANLERYGIPPERFARVLTSHPNVNAYAIFIGSLGNQADRLTEKLPSGRAFVCLDLKKIPQIMQQIFASSILSSK
ncbi:von Willebrand factor A domain-containing protein 8 isoform X2 [Cloeon dipterum]|uniref:von Willebrand factor A domain-containing protein 8 isoform X2 n=1 Tax=Cloeon dipterum TaxID=197152 RepID=UPI0032202CB6